MSSRVYPGPFVRFAIAEHGVCSWKNQPLSKPFAWLGHSKKVEKLAVGGGVALQVAIPGVLRRWRASANHHFKQLALPDIYSR